MTWNHRVIRKVYKSETLLGIHEVFYNDKGVPELVTNNPVKVVGDNLEGMQQTLDWMQKALGEPILEFSDFDEGGKYYKDSEELFDISTDGVDGNALDF